jgi:hypothetical protein
MRFYDELGIQLERVAVEEKDRQRLYDRQTDFNLMFNLGLVQFP